MFLSHVELRGSVMFPQYGNNNIYMMPFLKKDGLPKSARQWQGTVDTMLDGIETDLPIYLMVDESFVEAGKPQRRPGIHIDGYWGAGGHRGGGGHVPRHHSPVKPVHIPGGRHMSGNDTWETATFDAPEAIILASNVAASRAYVGEFDGPIRDGGNCEAVDISRLKVINLPANTAIVGNVTALHESTPVINDCWRQLVRLNVPGWTPERKAA